MVSSVPAVAWKSIQFWESRIMSIPKTSTDPITPWSPHKSNCKTLLVCIINRVTFPLVVACCIFIWKITKHYWYPCYRHNQVSKSHSFFDILLVLSLWAPKTIVFRSLWSWQWNNVKPLAVWQYNDAMSFYRHMKWECLSFHILEHFKYIFPCLVKTFDKFDAGLGEWKKEVFEYEIKTCLVCKTFIDQMENNGDVNIVTIIYKASVLLYIKKTLQLT